MMVNRFEIREVNPNGSEGRIIAVAQQKRLAFKEHVTFYADEARTQPVFSFRARQAIDLGARYDVFDSTGAPIGHFQKNFGASLLRTTFTLGAPGLNAVGSERSAALGLLRRVVDLPVALHFDFTDAQTGALVMTSERRFTLRDRYAVTVPDHRLDFRVAAAMAVGLDVLLDR